MESGLSIAEMYVSYRTILCHLFEVLLPNPNHHLFPPRSDSKLISIAPYIDDLKTFAKTDSKLSKLVTLNMTTLFDFLKRDPTPKNLKQYVEPSILPLSIAPLHLVTNLLVYTRLHAQTGFTKFASTLVSSEGALSIMVQHPAQPIVVHEKMELIECAQHGSVEAFEELLEKAPKDYLRSFEDESDGSSLLHYACRGGNIPIIRYILASNFPIDRQSRQHGSTRLTPLMEATKAGKLKAVKLLLNHGATLPKLRCSLNKSAMDYATNAMKLEIRDHVLKLRHGQLAIEPLQALPPGLPAPINSSSSIPRPIERPSVVSKPDLAPRESNWSAEQQPSSQPSKDARPAPSEAQAFQMQNFVPSSGLHQQPKAVEQPLQSQDLHRSMPASRAALLGLLNPEQNYTSQAGSLDQAPSLTQAANPAPPVNSTRQALLQHLNYPGTLPSAAKETQQPPSDRPTRAWNVEQSAPQPKPPAQQAALNRHPNGQHPRQHSLPQHHHHGHGHGHQHGHQHHNRDAHHGPRRQPHHLQYHPKETHHSQELHQAPAPVQHRASIQRHLPSPPQARHMPPPTFQAPVHVHPQLVPHMQAPPMGFHPAGFLIPPHMQLPPNFELPPQALPPQHNQAHQPTESSPPQHGSPDLRKSASSGTISESGNVSFVGAEDMFRLHPDLKGLPTVELVHELWNLVEALREEKQNTQRQLAEATSKKAAVDTNRAVECTVCFEEESEPWAFVPCGHFSPCRDCTAANQHWTRHCIICRSDATNRVRIYFA